MAWVRHQDVPPRWHLDCTSHRDFKASVVLDAGMYSLYVPGANPYLERFKSVAGLNKMLRILELEEFPEMLVN